MNGVDTGLATWWLIISMVFFLFGIGVLITLLVVMLKLVKMVQELRPKIETLTTRVDSIGKNLEELTAHVKVTAESVGGKAQSVATSVDSIAHLAANTFERFAPYIGGALAAMKLFSGFMQMKRSMAPKSLEVTTKETKIKRGKKSAA